MVGWWWEFIITSTDSILSTFLYRLYVRMPRSFDPTQIKMLSVKKNECSSNNPIASILNEFLYRLYLRIARRFNPTQVKMVYVKKGCSSNYPVRAGLTGPSGYSYIGVR
jgi:hypothetical protein